MMHKITSTLRQGVEQARLPLRFITAGIRRLRRFRSHWFYWHTGHPWIAVLSMGASAIILWVILGFSTGFSLVGILAVVLLDSLGFWLAILYLLFFRSFLPEWSGLQGSTDAFVVHQWVVPLLIGVFLNRGVSFLVAKISGYSFELR